MSDPTLMDYSMMFEGLLCRWDGAKLSGHLSHYNHPGGSPVSEFEMPQWISMACSKCGYEWSYSKILSLQVYTIRVLQGGQP